MKKAQILLVFFLVCGCKQEDAKKVESESLTQTIENVSTVSKIPLLENEVVFSR